MTASNEIGGGEAERNPLGGKITGRRQRDLNSITEVMTLAGEIARGDLRRATLASTDEVRAIAKLAAMSSLVMAKAAALVVASDAGNQALVAERMRDLTAATRPFMGMPQS